MAYTSSQYKWLLFQRLRRQCAVDSADDRAYTQSFFGKLLDDTITVTEEAYNNFVTVLDGFTQYCVDNRVYYDDDLSADEVNANSPALVDAFAKIGIDLVVEVLYTTSGSSTYASGGRCTFTKPNGEVMIYEVGSSLNSFCVYTNAGTEYNYAKASLPYYKFDNLATIPELQIADTRSAGQNCFWSYDADTTTMTITGDGTFVTVPTDSQVGAGAFDTLIIGANVSRFAAGSLSNPSIKQLVLLHASDVPLTLDESINGSANSSWTLDVYCDNEAFRNYEGFAPGLMISWHTLDEWDGGASTPERTGLYYNNIFLPVYKSPWPTYTFVMIGVTSDGRYFLDFYSSARTLASGATTIRLSAFIASRRRWLVLNDVEWYWCEDTASSRTVTPIWANYDIVDADGNVFLAASEPTITSTVSF